MVAQDCSGLPFLLRMGAKGGAKDGDNSGRRALPMKPTNWTDPKATALTKVELSLTNLRDKISIDNQLIDVNVGNKKNTLT